MEKETKVIKILKIESNKGYFLDKNNNFVEVDKIDRDSLFNLVSLTLDNDIEMDVCDEDNLTNKVHSIMYKDIYKKISDLNKNKESLLSNATNKYKEIIDKYKK